ncbi:MAG TPA: hypothetical protein VK256_11685 [Candidatus Eisenbacteria bacterium]|nr:hypothetical protein [Candidatus Eisenbacteria bacterium]
MQSWLATTGAITAITAVVVIIAGCVLPYVRYTEASPGDSQTASVFNGGFPGAWGNVPEPVLVIVFALAASVSIIAWPNRTARAFASGALVVMGAQTFMLFVGYAAAAAGSGVLQSGSFVGLFGSFLLFVGGAISAASLLTRPSEGSPASS